jgi:hypothetical protein
MKNRTIDIQGNVITVDAVTNVPIIAGITFLYQKIHIEGSDIRGYFCFKG